LGYGLRLIAGTADGLTIARRSEGGAEVRMRFDLDPIKKPAGIDQSRISCHGQGAWFAALSTTT
jgi:hypothetical protein